MSETDFYKVILLWAISIPGKLFRQQLLNNQAQSFKEKNNVY
ncbi:hypothetical protein VB834_26310 [Limnoraphis robusta Tam1]|uniref:Uncharacterized protein n=1 Tax=Limnoraphis robusta CCNP1315 TaxID=3110306 RepID=A0ABU5TVS0_9CYAN|nr:hypothetical protein [Limnoraphis robusta]MEA5495899.1 hypothetical protein [Limnoraphis robusta BA-68 BA1]MEA5518802.1 hypothetical protein [Limnoraphis robusta CCNP1315]MEA5542550.1 hypothetical protein [Limnoraphis robusta Tam1]MEA5548713.1 hypothetical protein [Limnoraphis robusta CCNP1324]